MSGMSSSYVSSARIITEQISFSIVLIAYDTNLFIYLWMLQRQVALPKRGKIL
jgi:hypothetical protein